MSTNVDLSAILSKPATEVEKPKPLPDGMYLGQIKGYTSKVAGANNNTVLDVQVDILQALDVEVAPEVLAGKSRRISFWLTPDALYRLKDFMVKDLGIEEGGKTLMEMLSEINGRMVKCAIVQETYTPKGKVEPELIDNIKSTYPVD